MSEAERVAAAAGVLDVGVPEDEPAVHQRLLPLDDRALQEAGALRIDEEPRPLALVDLVELRRPRRPVDEVGEPGAAAALHAEPEAALRGALLRRERPDPARRLLGDLDGHGRSSSAQ